VVHLALDVGRSRWLHQGLRYRGAQILANEFLSCQSVFANQEHLTAKERKGDLGLGCSFAFLGRPRRLNVLDLRVNTLL
jgi:hypothetical protein